MKGITTILENGFNKRGSNLSQLIKENIHNEMYYPNQVFENKVDILENHLGVNAEQVNEALIQLVKGKENQFGNIVILAGGAGSGKGFTLNNLLDIQGKVLDVDALKQAVLDNEKLKAKIKAERGVDLDDFNLRNPDDVGKLHVLIASEMKLTDRKENAFFNSVLFAHPDRKPNIVFDVTLKDMKKLHEIIKHSQYMGYDKKKIHIVWIMNDVEVAMEQNANRSRVVPKDILLTTHKGASETMATILNMGSDLAHLMDGKIVISFAKADVDVVAVKGDAQENSMFDRKDKKGNVKKSKPVFIKKANYWVVKEQGHAPKSVDELDEQIKRTITEYTSLVGNSAGW